MASQPAQHAPGPPPTEVEIKLLAPDAATLARIARLRSIGAFRLVEERTQELRSVYLDTAGFRLARHGVALRLRQDGARWELTAKWSGRRAGARHERPEINVSLDEEPKPPLDLSGSTLHPYLAALVMQEPLLPILVTDIRRRRRVAVRERGDETRPIAEIALDSVRLASPDRRVAAERYFEVEIEQRTGSPRELADLANQLGKRFALEPSQDSKFSRGLRLLGREVLPETDRTSLRADDTLHEALRKVVRVQLRRLRSNDPGTRLGNAPEALHDMRVAVRRLRAAVLAFKSALRPRLRADLRDDLKWLAQALGGVRDLDVQLENLALREASLPPAYVKALEPFRRYLRGERAMRRRTMLSALDSRRYFELLARLERYATGADSAHDRGPKAELPVARVGRRLLRKRFDRLLSLGRALGASSSPTELHAVRLQAKKLRYLLEFLRDFAGPNAPRVVKKLVEVQDRLGEHNDAHVAVRFVELYREEARNGLQRNTDLALKRVARAEEERGRAARAAFAHAWKRFSRTDTLGQMEAILARLKA